MNWLWQYFTKKSSDVICCWFLAPNLTLKRSLTQDAGQQFFRTARVAFHYPAYAKWRRREWEIVWHEEWVFPELSSPCLLFTSPECAKKFFWLFLHMLIWWAKLCQQRLLTEFSGCGVSSMETLLTVSGLLLEFSHSSFMHKCVVLSNPKNVEGFAVCRTTVIFLLDHCLPQFQLFFSLTCRVWTWINIAFLLTVETNWVVVIWVFRINKLNPESFS